MADSTLQAIRVKVRRLTRSLTPNLLSDAELDQYINTFVQYDFPEHLRLFNLRSLFTFYTIPGVDVYKTSTDPQNPLFNFVNKYTTVHPPIYVSGFQAQFSEDRNQFYGQYPLVNSIASIGVSGDGVTTRYEGVINSQQAQVPNNVNQNICLVQNNVLFESATAFGQPLAMIDAPLNDLGFYNFGNLYQPGTVPVVDNFDPDNFINYKTGQFVVTFKINGVDRAPAAGATINSQTIPQVQARPFIVLFYEGYFTVRPVPDQVYSINMEVYVRPTELLDTAQSPELQEWWQYIAYGAAKKVFEDRMDLDSIAQLMPEYKKQETLILRRTIVQQTSQRTSTIYADNNGTSGNYGPGFGNGGFF